MTTRIYILAGITLSSSLFLLPAVADSTIVLTDKGNGDSSQFQVKGEHVRISSTDEPGYTVYVKSRNVMIHVDDSKRSYYEIDLKTFRQKMRDAAQQMGQMRQQQDAYKKQMQAQLASMTPEQRRMLEQQMPGMLGPSGPVTHKAKGSVKINGYRCKAYEFYQQGQRIGKVCLASASATGIAGYDYTTLMSMMGFMQEMAGITSDLIGNTSEHDPLMLSNLKGIPVMMRNAGDKSDMAISSISSNTIDDKVFTAYKSYTRQPMEMMGTDRMN